MERCTVDRIEGAVAVLECGDGSMRDIPVDELPEGIREGMCLVFDDGKWAVDSDEEARRRERIQAKMGRLFRG